MTAIGQQLSAEIRSGPEAVALFRQTALRVSAARNTLKNALIGRANLARDQEVKPG